MEFPHGYNIGVAQKSFDEYRPRFYVPEGFNGNFLKGVAFSSDGEKLLTSSNDHVIRVFATPTSFFTDRVEYISVESQDKPNDLDSKLCEDISCTSKISEPGNIYSYHWMPGKQSLFVTAAYSQPVHLWDGSTGKLVRSYRTHDGLDEATSAHCCKFTPEGDQLHCGFVGKIGVFDVENPGKGFINEFRISSEKGFFGDSAITGIVSDIAFSPVDEVVAVGSFSGDVFLYDQRSMKFHMNFKNERSYPDFDMSNLGEVKNQSEIYSNLVKRKRTGVGSRETFLARKSRRKMGVSQLKYGKLGNYLFVNERRCDEIIMWDVRKSSQPYKSFQRGYHNTYQKLEFGIFLVVISQISMLQGKS